MIIENRCQIPGESQKFRWSSQQFQKAYRSKIIGDFAWKQSLK